MKTASLTFDELTDRARQAEENGDMDTAIDSYKKAIELQPADILPYNRLMILYRKKKMYKEELQLINDAIKNIQEAFDQRKSKPKSNATISRLSRAIMRSTGLTDKKGNSVYEPQPISNWKKRKQTVLKRLKEKA
jgi:tetratricopeptide (TPR) repeat protein